MGMWNWAEGFLCATSRISVLVCNKVSSVPKPPAETDGLKRTAETMHALAATADNKIHADVDLLISEATEQSKLEYAVNITYTRKLNATAERVVESDEFHAENDVDQAKVIGGLHAEMGMATPIFMWHPTVSKALRPKPEEGGYSMWVGVVTRPLRLGSYFVGNSKTDLRCGDAGGDMRETIVDIRTSKTRKIRYTAILYNVLGQRVVMLLPLVREGACLFRATLLRLADHASTTLRQGRGVYAINPAPESKMCFMDVYANISSNYFDMIWRGPSCGSVVLDGLWDRFKGGLVVGGLVGGGLVGGGGVVEVVEVVPYQRLPLDWSSPMDLLKAALCRHESERGNLEIHALTAALVFTFGFEATFSVLIDLVRCYTPGKYARSVKEKWILGFNVPQTILKILIRMSLTGALGCLAEAHSIIGALEEHTCPSWRRQAMLDAGHSGEDFDVKYDSDEEDEDASEDEGGATEHKGSEGAEASAAAGDGRIGGKKRAAADEDEDDDSDGEDEEIKHGAKRARVDGSEDDSSSDDRNDV